MTNDKAAPSNSAIQKLKIALIQSGQAQNPSEKNGVGFVSASQK